MDFAWFYRDMAEKVQSYVGKKVRFKGMAAISKKVLHLIENELAHIRIIIQKRICIEERHHLVYYPAFGHSVEKLL